MMIIVFVNVWLEQVVILPNFHDHDIRIGMKGKAVNASKILLYWIHISFAHNVTIGTLTDGNMELGSKKWVCYECQIFDKIIICIKLFY